MFGGSGNAAAFASTRRALIRLDGPSLRIDSRTAVTATASANRPTYRRTHSEERYFRAVPGADIPQLLKETNHGKRMAALGAALPDNGSSAHLGIRGEAAHAPIRPRNAGMSLILTGRQGPRRDVRSIDRPRCCEPIRCRSAVRAFREWSFGEVVAATRVGSQLALNVRPVGQCVFGPGRKPPTNRQASLVARGVMLSGIRLARPYRRC